MFIKDGRENGGQTKRNGKAEKYEKNEK